MPGWCPSERRTFPPRLALWLSLALPLAPVHAQTWQLAGRVVNVHDGDSLTIVDAQLRQHRVRLHGIDAPELGQAFGRVARRNLANLAAQREASADCHKSDVYTREVCTVVVGDVDVALAQLEIGLAWAFTRYERELPPSRQRQYRDAERRAREAQRGLWSEAQPVPPWQWRKAARARRSAP